MIELEILLPMKKNMFTIFLKSLLHLTVYLKKQGYFLNQLGLSQVQCMDFIKITKIFSIVAPFFN